MNGITDAGSVYSSKCEMSFSDFYDEALGKYKIAITTEFLKDKIRQIEWIWSKFRNTGIHSNLMELII